ncbi:MAG TPA: protein kinase, partial [Thermoanaerobaculia bacterium]
NRFVQEAKAASGLNHPHVIAIHDIGADASTHYIAMELIEGETLREKLQHGRLELKKTATLAAQIAEALAAAHAAGIVHRDLKPENVMVASSGYVKILDFGLAKLRGSGAPSSAESATAIKGTEPGKVMGTVGYMSPEQAQGKEVDGRSDLFSLGCILYELSTGLMPFRGNSSIDTLHKIIYSDAEPLRQHLPNAPMELQWILRKALAKDPEDRYQSAKDMAIDLRDLVRELDSNPSGATIAAVPLRRRRGWLIAIAGLLLVVAAAILSVFVARSKDPTAPNVSQQLKIKKLTSNGKVISAAISPDGKFISYVVSDQGEQSLWLRQLSNAQSLELVPPRQVAYWGNVFTPDGGAILYGIRSNDEPKGAFYQISTLGGTPRKVLSGIDSVPAFSPDGKQMAWVRDDFPAEGESSLVAANTDGSNPRVLAKRSHPELLARIFFAGPSWSPDGKRIVTAAFLTTRREGKFIEVDVTTGQERVLSDGWAFAAQVGWLPDGSGLLAIARSKEQREAQVWFIPYPTGKPRPITNDLFEYRIISLTQDGSSLVTIPYDTRSDIWSAALDGSSRPKKLTDRQNDGLRGVERAPDGRIAFTSTESDSTEIWIMNSDGSQKTQLTFDGAENRYPTFTPDGKTIVYNSTTGSGANLRSIGVDGTNARVLVDGVLIDAPACSRDGKSVIFARASGLMRLDLASGSVVPLTRFESLRPAVSHDGARMAFYCSEGPNAGWSICVMQLSSGEMERKIENVGASSWSMLEWSQDDKALYTNAAPSDRANLWRIPLDGASSRVTDFDERVFFHFDISDDGQLIYSRGDLSRDAVLITGFR